jgi:hypothetical protein
MLIRIKELVGENAMTLGDGEVVYRCIHDRLVRGESIQLDFDGVRVFASPFFNAGIGRLLADLQPAELNDRLQFEHISEVGVRVLRRVVENAKDYYASPERRQTIDHIVNETVAHI